MTKLQPQVLQHLYHDEGKSIRAIADHLHVSPRTVYEGMMVWRIPRRSAAAAQQRTAAHPQLDERTLRRLYLDEQLSIRAIAEQLAVTQRTVAAALSQWNIPRRHSAVRSTVAHRPGMLPVQFDEPTLRALYLDGNSTITEIATAFSVSSSTVRNALHQWQIPTRRKGPREARV